MLALLLAAQLATAPGEPHERWVHASLAAALLAHSSDLASTSYAMGRASEGRGGYREANPFMRPFAADPVLLAVVKMGLAGGVNYAMWRVHQRRPKTVIAVALLQAAAVGYIAHRNATTLGLR